MCRVMHLLYKFIWTTTKSFGFPVYDCRCIVVFCRSNKISLTLIICSIWLLIRSPCKFTLYNRTAINKFTKNVVSIRTAVVILNGFLYCKKRWDCFFLYQGSQFVYKLSTLHFCWFNPFHCGIRTKTWLVIV